MEKTLGTVYCAATDCYPKQCHCGAMLSKPTHGYVEAKQPISNQLDFIWPTPEAERIGKCWHIVCVCNARYIWGWYQPRNGAWFVYPVWPMDKRELLPDDGARYIRLR